MRLLFDQNLSPYLHETLRDLYPESLHVRTVGLLPWILAYAATCVIYGIETIMEG